jgi:hypothetical protein
LHDPEELGLHISFYPPHNQLLDSLSQEPSSSIVPSAYIPLYLAPGDQEIQIRGGYLSRAFAAQDLLSVLHRSQAGDAVIDPTARYRWVHKLLHNLQNCRMILFCFTCLALDNQVHSHRGWRGH